MPVHHSSHHVLEQITDGLTRLRGDSAGDGDTTTPQKEVGEGNGASPGRQPSPHLFRCPSCEMVYIAYTRETCETCHTDVTEVR